MSEVIEVGEGFKPSPTLPQINCQSSLYLKINHVQSPQQTAFKSEHQAA